MRLRSGFLRCCYTISQLKGRTQGRCKGQWRYRIGDYRLICLIGDHELIILALSIGHRQKCTGTRYDKTASATDDRSAAGAVFMKIDEASTMRCTNNLAPRGRKRLLHGG
ncbi:type II toxin-antitoxin system RelE family toxin [Pyramidobacter sp.]|uniref:type II toxin-antitoxin system RelE family toxin n=1 Tax=Pyramidobacter sp. TaxID=1943581 RepID=UPI0039C6B863